MDYNSVSPGIRAQWQAATQRQAQGGLQSWNVAALPLPPGSGLVPVSPALLAKSVVSSAPSPEQVAAQVRSLIDGAVSAVRLTAPLVAGLGGVTAAAAPLLGAAGRAAAPALAAIPYVGPALSAAASVIEPVAAVGGTVVGGVAAVTGAAANASASPQLQDVGARVVDQLNQLAQGQAQATTTP